MIEYKIGDSLKILQDLYESGCQANLVLADPPYGVDFQSNRRPAGEKLAKIANDEKPFIRWLPYAFKITKDPGAIVVFCEWRHSEVWKSAIELAGYEIRSQIVWDKKTHGMGDLNGAFAPQHELAWFGVKGNYKFPGKRPKSVVSISRVHSSKITHPNEKPVNLMSYLISHLVPAGGLVVDPFAGSGPVLKACALLKDRDAIGIDISDLWIEACLDEVEALQSQLNFAI